jgi:hypothetical protein
LRRGTDRAETCLVGALLVAAATTAPFAVQAASHAAWQGALHTRQEQRASRYPVTALLTQAAGTPIGEYAIAGSVPAFATWTSVTGLPRSGIVPALAGSPKGTAITVYTDRAGDLVIAPLTITEVTNEADAAGIGTAVGIALAAFGGAAAIRQLINRRRMAAWTADWAISSRTWNRQNG